MFLLAILCLSLYATNICEGYKVLMVFPTAGKSHSILGNGIARHLLKAGHEVTYVTAFPSRTNLHPSLREIDISSQHKFAPEELFSIERFINKEVDMQGLTALITMFHEVNVACLEHENVKKLLNDPQEHFDVVILEWMFVELISGISAIFNCPYIWLSTVDPHWMVLKLIDEIPNSAYVTGVTSSNEVPLTFLQRAEELMQMVSAIFLQYFFVHSQEHKDYERLLVPFIRKRGHPVPDYEQLRYNTSLMLGNSHVSMGQPTRLPQNYKPVGGFHIDPSIEPLSENLKKLLDNAKHGLIYFSMGTLAKSKNMPAQVKVNLLKMFGKLKQTVLWKFEEDLPNRPSNVHIIKWAPQQSILAHPNCILFISHGGLLSTTEAIYFGKPIIGIPVFGDQFNNVDRYVKRGIAKRVDLSHNMAEDLKKAINDIMTDSSYSSNVKALSVIHHDRPVSPGKEVVYWIEHVVRTGGAPHLRSPALLVPWYQKWYLDLAAVIAAGLWTLVIVIRRLTNKVGVKQKKKIH